MPAGKIDPIGGMFKAQVAMDDKASKPLKSISENIDKAVEGSEKLKDEFDGLNRGVEKLHEKTEDVLKKTKDMGIIGAALLGTKGRGSIKDQIKGAKDETASFSKFIGGALTSNIGDLAGAAYTAYQAFQLFAAPVSTMAGGAFAALPALFASAAQSAIQMVGPVEQMRQTIKMTNDEAYRMTGSIVEGAAAFGHSIGEATEMVRQLGEEGRKGAKDFDELVKASLLLESAFTDPQRGLLVDVQDLRRRLVDVGEQGPKAFVGIANAMQHVASTTVLTHGEIQGLINTITNSLIWKLPRDLRTRAMPRIIADISTIAGEWQRLMGDPAVLTQGFDAALDIFDEGGHRLKAMIIGLGGATADSMQKMLDDADAGGFFLAQAKAVQNLKDELGSEEFTRLAPMFAEQMGTTREELQKMSLIDLGKLQKQMEVTRKLTEDNKDVVEAWGRATGIFNNIWDKIKNIADALLAGLGRPLLKVLIPIIDYFDKFLDLVVASIGGFSAASTEAGGLAVMIGAIASAIKIVWPLVSMLIGALTAEVVVAAIGAIGSALLAAASAAAPFIAAGMAIVGVLVVAKKAWDDFAGPIVDVVDAIFGRIWNLAKIVGEFFVLMSPIGVVIAALATQWDAFMEELEPGIQALEFAWHELGRSFQEVGGILTKALGTAGGAAADNFSLFELFADGLKIVAKTIGFLAAKIAQAISLIMLLMKPFIWMVGKFVEPFVKLFGMLTDDKTRLSDIFTSGDTWGAIKNVGKEYAGGNQGGSDLSWVKAAAEMPAAASGGFVNKDTPAMVHANEAIVPLEKMPEFVQQSVTIDQQAVVDEVRKLRETIEMLARRGNSGTMLYSGGA